MFGTSLTKFYLVVYHPLCCISSFLLYIILFVVYHPFCCISSFSTKSFIRAYKNYALLFSLLIFCHNSDTIELEMTSTFSDSQDAQRRYANVERVGHFFFLVSENLNASSYSVAILNSFVLKTLMQ